MTEREYIVQRPPAGPSWDEQACRNLAATVLTLAVEDLRDDSQRASAEACIHGPVGAFWCWVAGLDIVAFREAARLIAPTRGPNHGA